MLAEIVAMLRGPDGVLSLSKLGQAGSFCMMSWWLSIAALRATWIPEWAIAVYAATFAGAYLGTKYMQGMPKREPDKDQPNG